MNIKQNIVTKNPCYTCGRTITVKGLMIHSVGCPQPRASVFANNWNNANANVCVHAVLQADGTVLQLLPWNRRGVALWKRKQRKRKQYPYRRRNDRAGHDSVHGRKQL